MTEIETDEEARHRGKMAKRKAVQDAEVASKTIAKGLLHGQHRPRQGQEHGGLRAGACGRSAMAGGSAWCSSSRAATPASTQALKRFGDRWSWHTMGEGFTWETQDRARDIAACHARLGAARRN